MTISRRNFLVLSSATGTLAMAGCCPQNRQLSTATNPPSPKWSWTEFEQNVISTQGEDFAIVTRQSEEAKVLRCQARPVSQGVDLSKVEACMEKTMNKATGVGLAGPQVGLSLRVATLMLDYKEENPKTVFVRNPVIVERSDETIEGYEGCLSIPGVGGMVRRNRWIKIEHTTKEGEIITTEAEDYNAVLWQHELDHLDGILYVDKLLGELLPMEEVRRIRKEMDEKANPKPPAKTDTETDQARLIDSSGPVYFNL